MKIYKVTFVGCNKPDLDHEYVPGEAARDAIMNALSLKNWKKFDLDFSGITAEYVRDVIEN